MDERFWYVTPSGSVREDSSEIGGPLGIILTLLGGAWYGKVEMANQAAPEAGVLAELEGIAEAAEEGKS